MNLQSLQTSHPDINAMPLTTRNKLSREFSTRASKANITCQASIMSNMMDWGMRKTRSNRKRRKLSLRIDERRGTLVWAAADLIFIRYMMMLAIYR